MFFITEIKDRCKGAYPFLFYLIGKRKAPVMLTCGQIENNEEVSG